MAKRKRRKRYQGPKLTEQLQLSIGDTVILTAEDWDERGATTAVIDGAPVSIGGAIPGEKIEAEVIKIFPDRVATFASAALEVSEDRVTPPCEYFGKCSGCQWQHISYDRQLNLKRGTVLNALDQYPSIRDAEVMPTLPSPARFGYRNHARFTVGKHGDDIGKAGFVNADTRRFLPIDRCLIMSDLINDKLNQLQGRLKGMTQFSVRAGANTGDSIIQPLLPAQIQDVASGRQRYREEANGLTFQVAASSFFQVNTAQLENMIKEIIEMLDLKGDETLVDLYCGVGTFTAMLASRVGKAIGIEESASAIEDARRNTAGMNNVSFIAAKSESAAGELSAAGLSADIVIIDPPRVGCAPETLPAVEAMQPSRVIMVSCNPDTMARDLDALCARAFRLIKVRPIDMFPQTRQVEAIALMEHCRLMPKAI